MPRTVIYHNPRCSKSRETLALLQEHDVEPEIIEYLKTPPTAAQLDEILRLLKLEPRQLMRSGESEYVELGLDDPALDRAQLIKAMVEHPRLIQRPIVLNRGRAALGRPPQQVLELFDNG
jgi:arsenate reductase